MDEFAVGLSTALAAAIIHRSSYHLTPFIPHYFGVNSGGKRLAKAAK